MSNVVKLKTKKKENEIYDDVIAIAIKYNGDKGTDMITLLEPDGMPESRIMYCLDVARQMLLDKVSKVGKIAKDKEVLDIQKAMRDKLDLAKKEDE